MAAMAVLLPASAAQQQEDCLDYSCARDNCPSSHPVPTRRTNRGCCAFAVGPCHTCCAVPPPPPPLKCREHIDCLEGTVSTGFCGADNTCHPCSRVTLGVCPTYLGTDCCGTAFGLLCPSGPTSFGCTPRSVATGATVAVGQRLLDFAVEVGVPKLKDYIQNMDPIDLINQGSNPYYHVLGITVEDFSFGGATASLTTASTIRLELTGIEVRAKAAAIFGVQAITPPLPDIWCNLASRTSIPASGLNYRGWPSLPVMILSNGRQVRWPPRNQAPHYSADVFIPASNNRLVMEVGFGFNEYTGALQITSSETSLTLSPNDVQLNLYGMDRNICGILSSFIEGLAGRMIAEMLPTMTDTIDDFVLGFGNTLFDSLDLKDTAIGVDFPYEFLGLDAGLTSAPVYRSGSAVLAESNQSAVENHARLPTKDLKTHANTTDNRRQLQVNCRARQCARDSCPSSHPMRINPTSSGCCAFAVGPCITCCQNPPPPPPPPRYLCMPDGNCQQSTATGAVPLEQCLSECEAPPGPPPAPGGSYFSAGLHASFIDRMSPNPDLPRNPPVISIEPDGRMLTAGLTSWALETLFYTVHRAGMFNATLETLEDGSGNQVLRSDNALWQFAAPELFARSPVVDMDVELRSMGSPTSTEGIPTVTIEGGVISMRGQIDLTFNSVSSTAPLEEELFILNCEVGLEISLGVEPFFPGSGQPETTRINLQFNEATCDNAQLRSSNVGVVEPGLLQITLNQLILPGFVKVINKISDGIVFPSVSGFSIVNAELRLEGGTIEMGLDLSFDETGPALEHKKDSILMEDNTEQQEKDKGQERTVL
eukprot:SAG25_NODE_8_length_29132_cov_108.213895_3_plen_822_part_00